MAETEIIVYFCGKWTVGMLRLHNCHFLGDVAAGARIGSGRNLCELARICFDGTNPDLPANCI